MSSSLPSNLLQTEALDSDASLLTVTKISDLKTALENWQPAIPTSVVKHYFGSAGGVVKDEAVLKAVACEVQHYMTSIINEARQSRQLKHATQNVKKAQAKAKKTNEQIAGTSADELKAALTAEDIAKALEAAGVPALRSPYFV